MDIDGINAYLARAREIIGDRTEGGAAYDNAVVAFLTNGQDIKKAISMANREHPAEALKPGANDWPDLAARYEYLKEHNAILKKLGMNE
jgi:hypothetical protein